METTPLTDEDCARRIFFDQQAEWWDEKIEDYTATSLFGRWWREAAPASGQTVLELGCGTGRILPHSAHAVGATGCAIAGDISLPMLARAQRRCRAMGARIAPLQLDARRLPLPNGVADAILIPNTLPHLQPLEMALDECHRVLRPLGRLEIIHFASRDHINGVHIEHGGIIAQDLIPPLPDLIALLQECGFSARCAEDEADHLWVSAVRRCPLQDH